MFLPSTEALEKLGAQLKINYDLDIKNIGSNDLSLDLTAIIVEINSKKYTPTCEITPKTQINLPKQQQKNLKCSLELNNQILQEIGASDLIANLLIFSENSHQLASKILVRAEDLK